MRTHVEYEMPATLSEEHCLYCFRKLASKHSCVRHMVMCSKKNRNSEIVSPPPEKVPPEGKIPEKVPLSPEKVPPFPENVSLTKSDDAPSSIVLKCPDCYKTFSCMYNLKAHKSSCQRVQHPMSCPVCSEICTSKAQKSRHVKKCTAQIIQAPTEYNQCQIQQHTNSHNTITNSNNSIVNNIVLNFGSETKEHITQEQMDSWSQLIRGIGIFKFLEAVHFNPEVKQNHNIRLDNGSKKVLQVFHNDKWVRRAAAEVTELLITNGRDSLLGHYLQSGPIRESDSDSHMIYTDLLNTTMDNKPNVYYKLVRQILCKIVDITEAMMAEEDLAC